MRNNFKTIIIALSLSLFTGGPVYSEMSIEELVREGMLKSQSLASTKSSGNAIPDYSESKALEQASDIDQMDDAELKTSSHKKMLSASSNSATGISRDAMSRKVIDNYENQEIFTKAEKINEDPIEAFERITNEGCREKENKQKNQYKKVITKEKHTDIEVYEDVCEKPTSKINCEKTLNVSCEKTEECEAGGIVLGSMESGFEWEYNYPSIRFGSREGSWKYNCEQRKGYPQCCEKIKSIARFKLRDIKEIKAFILKKVAFDDHAMVKVNGHMVYNSWGGNQLEITNKHVDKRHPDGSWLQGEFTLFVDAGNEKGGACFQWLGESHYKTMDIDLRDLLKEGWNEIEMTLIYSELGQFNIEIEARQQCCTKLTDKWEKRCWAE